jgi:hypothetical protein
VLWQEVSINDPASYNDELESLERKIGWRRLEQADEKTVVGTAGERGSGRT